MKRLNLIKALLVALAFQSMQAMDLGSFCPSLRQYIQIFPNLQNNPNCVNENNRTALHLAAMNGDLQAVQDLVLNLGIELDIQDKSNAFTALHCAVYFAKQNRDAIVQFLVNQGANKHLKNNTDETAFDLAFQRNYKPTMELLLGDNKPRKQKPSARTDADQKGLADVKQQAEQLQAQGTTRQLSLQDVVAAGKAALVIDRTERAQELARRATAKRANEQLAQAKENELLFADLDETSKTSVLTLKNGAKVLGAAGLGYAGKMAYQNFNKELLKDLFTRCSDFVNANKGKSAAVAGVATLGTLAYQAYKNWDGIKHFATYANVAGKSALSLLPSMKKTAGIAGSIALALTINEYRKGNINKEGIKSFFDNIHKRLILLMAFGGSAELANHFNFLAENAEKGSAILTQETAEVAKQAAIERAAEEAAAAKLARGIEEVAQDITEHANNLSNMVQAGQEAVERQAAARLAEQIAAEKAAAAEAARQAATAEAERLAAQAAAERQATLAATPVVSEEAAEQSEPIINLDI